ncbi:uncharacterized protein ARMOST_06234 [Armillaria ostoyae]|uniref:Uncharacterized protein n=1 Tax=Armillaria ostoyae TaxID=47428 RepID=A0A284R2F3_ARMOS|nr:uncharacterized protein ARMOST_06234 [Armillaria ostoyae]
MVKLIQCVSFWEAHSLAWPTHPGWNPEFMKNSNPNGYTEAAYLQLEKQVATHYTDTFFLYFGHAPTLPRQLGHNPEESYIPECHQRVLMVQQGLYKDVSEWEQ